MFEPSDLPPEIPIYAIFTWMFDVTHLQILKIFGIILKKAFFIAAWRLPALNNSTRSFSSDLSSFVSQR